LQELLRVARLAEPCRVQEELDLYNRLLPGRNRLQAALLIAIPDESRLADDLVGWQALGDEDLWLAVGDMRFPSHLVTCRPEDRCIGMAHWVEFAVDAEARALLADSRLPARFEVALPSYQHESPLLSEDVRQSLLDDLQMSDKD
jgi:hypothetical protein